MDDYQRPVEARFSPYAMNGGTVLGLSGEDYAILASDTRLSEGFSIYTRDSPKSYKVTDNTVMGSVGFHGDVLTLTKIIEARLKIYEHDHRKKMSCAAVAAMLSTILYYRRFFPYYTYNLIAGIDDKGKGAVYSFDPVGSYQRENCRAAGSASSMLQPILDNQIECKNLAKKGQPMKISLEKAIELVKDVFISAAERDIYTGDAVLLNIITKDGVREIRHPLRRD
ncbi:proteasome subunit beta type-1-B-like [Argonauta hians]